MGLIEKAATAATNTGLGMLMSSWEDRRQQEQQKKLNAIAFDAHKQQAQFNQGMALDMWNKTGYGAQRKQLEDAGLNVGLMYGSAGQGGTTQGAGANAGAPQAAGSKGEWGMGMQLGMQMKMQEAQIKVAESQANLNNTQASKLGGADTDKTKAETQNLAAQTDNVKLKNIYQQYENEMRKIDVSIRQDFQADERGALHNAYNKAYAEAEIALNELDISDETKEKEIELLNNRTVEQAANIAATRASTKLDEAKAKQVEQEIKNLQMEVITMMSRNNAEWYKLSLEERDRELRQWETEIKERYADFDTGTTAEIIRGTKALGDVAATAKGYNTKNKTTTRTTKTDNNGRRERTETTVTKH